MTKKYILVPTFLDDSHFNPYILFLSLLVPKKRFPFWFLLLHHKRKKLMWQKTRINNTKLMSTWLKLIIKNVTSASKLKN